jgi:S1-C subfamily serine protease
LLVSAVLALLWVSETTRAPTLQIEEYDPRSPRRPLPQWSDEAFVIEDRPGGPADSMGTTFAVDRQGTWLTAGHVIHDCARVGIEEGGVAREVFHVVASREADAALVRGGMPSGQSLPLSDAMPPPGSVGYHMGFPGGQPTLVISELIGAARARRGRAEGGRAEGGRAEGARSKAGQAEESQPVLAWAERTRIPMRDGTLSGISGGPVFAEDGHVVGVNSAATDRRGRILTVPPDAMARLVTASRAVSDRPVAYPFIGPGEAQARFQSWLAQGVIRRIFCDVDDHAGRLTGGRPKG